MAEPLLTIESLCKAYGKQTVLHGVSLSISRQEIVGLLGCNGAGKTTLIRCVLQLSRRQRGSMNFDGRPLTEELVRRHFGYLPENFVPPKNLTGPEFLAALAAACGRTKKEVGALFDKVGLAGNEHKRIAAYSRGMIQRLGLAAALIKDPEVFILDEPTLGLDPIAQAEMLAMMLRLKNEGRSVFFSTHILAQIKRVCDRVAVMHQGRIRYFGSVDSFLAKHGTEDLDEAFLKETRS